MVLLCRFFVGLCRGDSELAWVCCGFCNRWQQKWFLCASSSRDTAGEKTMFEIVVASGEGSTKSGSSLSVLRETVPGGL